MPEKLKVNPTRMELKRLKERLKTASRGHKMLKDKSDEMIRRFVIFARENKKLREEVEQELANALQSFLLAKSTSDDFVIQEAVAMAGHEVELDLSTKNVMNVQVPKIEIKEKDVKEKYPYSFISVTSELDSSIATVSELLVKLVKLAEIEKTCNMLAMEIEKNRRRVNALEYVMIPQTQEAIKDITMKLDENERSNTVRLMKVKTIIQK
ncbi:MAG: V-type ATP synthase subunit D [Christensenella sp.]|nr:V-type ATP synthase subunit D [Christensenella sp.]